MRATTREDSKPSVLQRRPSQSTVHSSIRFSKLLLYRKLLFNYCTYIIILLYVLYWKKLLSQSQNKCLYCRNGVPLGRDIELNASQIKGLKVIRAAGEVSITAQYYSMILYLFWAEYYAYCYFCEALTYLFPLVLYEFISVAEAFHSPAF